MWFKKGDVITVSADYTLLSYAFGNETTSAVNIYLYNLNSTGNGGIAPLGKKVKVGEKTRLSQTFTVAVDGAYYPVFTINSGKVKIENIQIEYGNTVTDYEPYQENKIDLLNTQELNGVKGVNDYIEVIDKGNGLYDLQKTKNIDSVDLGTLPWNKTTVFYVKNSITFAMKADSDGLCKEFSVIPHTSSISTEDYIETRTDDFLYFRFQANSIYKDMTASQFRSAMNGIILYYQLKTPVVTTIATNLTYSQVSALRTNGGLLRVNGNSNRSYVLPDVTMKENYQYKN